MSIKAVPKVLITALVLSYPLLVHWLLPLWFVLPRIALMIFPALLNAWLAWIFGRTLRSGQEPLIGTFARLEREQLHCLAEPKLLPRMASYTRRLTQIWSALFILMALIAAVLAVSGQFKMWMIFTGVISYLLVGVLFVGEYIYRRLHFPNDAHATPFQLGWLLIKLGPLWMRRT